MTTLLNIFLNLKRSFRVLLGKKEANHKLGEIDVLVPTGIPGFVDAAIFESILGRTFSHGGDKVCYVICQGILPACHLVKFRKVGSVDRLLSGSWKSSICNNCIARAEYLKHDGSNVVSLDALLSNADRKFVKKLISGKSESELKRFSYEKIMVSEHARSGALRFLAIGDEELEPRYFEVYQAYLEAALLTLFAFNNLMSKAKKLRLAYLNHGIYTPQGIFNDGLKTRGINFYTWNIGYRNGTMLFSRGDTYHKTMTNVDDSWQQFNFDENKQKRISDYLEMRSSGALDWISFNRNSRNSSEFKKNLPEKYVSLFTNVNWDAQLHFDHNVFDNHLDWITKTIDYFSKNQASALVIRVHPAELYGATPSRQKLTDDLNRIYGRLASNILVVGPEDKLSSYKLAQGAVLSIVYGSKLGIELPALGYRVVIAGDSWARGKGFTYDCSCEKEYFDVLTALLKDDEVLLDAQKAVLAKKYAYHYFFRRLVDVNGLEKNDNGQLRIKAGDSAERLALDPTFLSIARQMMQSVEVVNEFS